ncbi:MAG: PDZ domain-containing protein, partial [Flavipsychrobacter sp.]
MKNKILIPLIVLGALAAFFSFKYSGNEAAGEERKVAVLETVMKAIKEGHYSPREINDTFSSRVYHKVLEDDDYEKKFFTQQDINQLSKYEFQIDDEINSGSLEFYHAVNDVFIRDVKNAENYYKEILKTPFTFNGNDSVHIDGEKMAYAADTNALKDRWKDYLKYRVLAKYVDLKNAQQKRVDDKDTSLKVAKTDAQLESDAREAVRKNQERYFKQLNKIKEDDRFAMYINAITGTEDPHTDYFPPKAKRRFDEEMSGTFFGIGAQLQQDGGKIKIVAIITGSPCWKQGELKVGDEIMKVGQGSAEPVDIEGYEIDDAVQLIRGKKGTEVRLTVKEASGAIKVIPIIRGEVQQEDIFAKSVIIKSKGGPIGYIYLREFYSDFQHINGRRSAEDVK